MPFKLTPGSAMTVVVSRRARPHEDFILFIMEDGYI